MPHLTCMRGLPASGKTTRAKAIAANTGAAVIGRDPLRHMLYDNYKPGNDAENTVSIAEKAVVTALLKNRQDVILDACHINPQYLKEWAKVASQCGATFSVEDVHTYQDVTQEANLCVKRDIGRAIAGERHVGEAVIRRMAKRARFPDIKAKAPIDLHQPVEWVRGLPCAVLVDIDGTLAHMQGRSPYDYSRVREDAVDENVAELVRSLSHDGFEIILCSGRDDTCMDDTVRWLQDNSIQFDQLLMRPTEACDNNGLKLPDWQIKLDLFNTHVRGKFNVLCVLDDRQQVVDMWRNVLELKCLQVQPGDF